MQNSIPQNSNLSSKQYFLMSLYFCEGLNKISENVVQGDVERLKRSRVSSPFIQWLGPISMFCGHTTVFLGQMLGSLGEADLLGQKQGGSKGDGWIWTAHIRSRGFVHSESHRSFSSHEKNSITLLVMAVASTLQQPAWLWGKYQVNGQLKTVVECICSLTHDITSTRVVVDLLFTFLLRTSVVNFFYGVLIITGLKN